MNPGFSWSVSTINNERGTGANADDKVVGRGVFQDGSELVYFGGGSVPLRESKFKKALVGAERWRALPTLPQPVRYDEPSPSLWEPPGFSSP